MVLVSSPCLRSQFAGLLEERVGFLSQSGARIGHEAAIGHAPRGINLLRQRRRQLRRLNSVASGARVAFDKNADVAARRNPRFSYSGNHFDAVCDHGNVGAPRELGKSPQLVSADNVERQQHVRDTGIGHHFRLTQFLDGDAGRTECELIASERSQLVGLDVGAVSEPQPVAALLPAPQIAVDDIDVDDWHRRLEFLERAASRFEFEEIENVHLSCFPGS